MSTTPCGNRMLAAAASLVLVACGGSASDSTPTAGPTSTDAVASEAAATESPPATDTGGPTTDAPAGSTDSLPATERLVTDWQGREIVVPAEPERVVALSPTPAMNLALLGFDVIALPVDLSDSFDDRFRASVPAGTNIDDYEVIGIGDTLNLEALARLEPDVIIGYSRIEEAEPTAFEVLSEIAPTVLYDFGTNADWRANFDQDVEIVGAVERATDVEAGYESALAQLADAGDTTVAFVRYEINGGGLWRLENATTSVPGSIMVDAGVNVFEAPEGLGELNATGSFIPEISGELLGQLTADIIVVQDLTQFGQADPLELFATNPLWQTLPAVQNGRVISLPTFVFNGGTYASAIETIERIAAAL